MNYNSKFREISKLEEIIENDDFLVKMMHEIKTPIHGILGISCYLYENWEYINDEVKKASIKEMSKSGVSLERLVNKLLLSLQADNKAIIYDMQIIDLIPVVKDIVGGSDILLANKNSVSISLINKVKRAKILADPLWVGQVLTNLIINALKHSNCRNVEINVDTKKVRARSKEVVISVIDDGTGIPEEELETIFDLFEQGSKEGVSKTFSADHFGIGLSLCREIIIEHDGKIWAKNNILCSTLDNRQGATVAFSLPIIGED